MAFDANIIHWRSVAEFANALATIKRPAWCKRLCNHNTYKPDETEWRGMASMQGLLVFYRDTKQWSSGPHLFLAATAPDPKDTGIFQLTPITHPGTHAGACNADALGLENVGDFNARPPTNAQYTLLLTVNRLLLAHWGIPPAQVVVHNECMTGRTCPGKYLTGTQIRADLAKGVPPPKLHTVTAGPFGAIAQQDRRPGALAARYYPPGTLIACDDLTSSYWHTVDQAGFIPLGQVQA